MTRTTLRGLAGGLLAALALAAGTTPAAAQTGAKPSTYHNAFTAADVRFMTDMIAHHNQATLIASWAPSHGANPAVQTMAERIVVGQNDEIALMENWLRDNGQPVPPRDSTGAHAGMAGGMAGMSHTATGHAGMDHASMPGMLTPEQLAALDRARGPEFDRLFLTGMIHHHQGALAMVDTLFGTNGAGQNEAVFRLASDIYADQSTEIDRMQKMLLSIPSPSH